MQDPEINEGLRSSWENVYKMPDKADAALMEFEETKAGTEALTPTKERTGLHSYIKSIVCCTLNT